MSGLWLVFVLLLLGFPISIASLLALPFARMAERALDARESSDRKKFLAERRYPALSSGYQWGEADGLADDP